MILRQVNPFTKYFTLPASVYLPMSGVEPEASCGSMPLHQYTDSPVTLTTDGVRGSALVFDGTSGVLLGSSRDSCFWLPDLCPDGFTLSVWFKVTAILEDGFNDYILTNGGHSSQSYGVAIGLRNSHRMFVGVRTKTEAYNVDIVDAISLHHWYHAVFTWSLNTGLVSINSYQMYD